MMMMDPPANQYEGPKRRSSPLSRISRNKANCPRYKYKRIAVILSLTVLSLFWVVSTVYLQRISAKIGQQSGIIIFNNTKYASSEIESQSVKGELLLVIGEVLSLFCALHLNLLPLNYASN